MNRRLLSRSLMGLGIAASLTPPALAGENPSVQRIDEVTLRKGGAFLDGRHDDAPVLQALIDRAAIATPYTSCPVLLFDLPAGAILLGSPLRTGHCHVTFRGAGQDLTILLMRAGGSGLIVHGTEQDPARGYLQLQDIGLTDGNPKGSGCSGLSIRFAPDAPQSAMTWQGVALRKWTQAARIINCPRNWHCENVTVFGPDFAMQPGAGLEISSTPHFSQGCFTYIFINVLIANYTWGWDYDIQAPLEGQRFYACTCYNGWGMVRAKVHATPDASDGVDETYRSVIWYFMDCDWQGLGYALDLVHCRNIVVRGGFYIANRNTDRAPVPDQRPKRRYMSFVGCSDILLDGVKFDVFVGSEPDLVLVYVDGTSDNFRARDTNVLSYAPIGAAFEFGDPGRPNPKRNTLSEIDTLWAAWSGGDRVRDAGGNQIAQSEARAQGGEMTSSGQVFFKGMASVTARRITIAFPRRPSGHPWFASPPAVFAQGQGANPDAKILMVTVDHMLVACGMSTTMVAWTATGD